MLVELSKPDEELKLVRPRYEGPASRFERRSVDRFVPCGPSCDFSLGARARAKGQLPLRISFAASVRLLTLSAL